MPVSEIGWLIHIAFGCRAFCVLRSAISAADLARNPGAPGRPAPCGRHLPRRRRRGMGLHGATNGARDVVRSIGAGYASSTPPRTISPATSTPGGSSTHINTWSGPVPCRGLRACHRQAARRALQPPRRPSSSRSRSASSRSRSTSSHRGTSSRSSHRGISRHASSSRRTGSRRSRLLRCGHSRRRRWRSRSRSSRRSR